ncbi:glycosyltransferase family 2 protein [Persicimonas caeni]|uniref:Glycosyltransferase family 2 protein n=1 Tax=Persicimonas caeni TaxID=2292766 RepID=A0A4Y6PVG1_PERCE|nr:glycosyltransferase family A protein [Persicimonas caeni]QDG52109.1 glycosyltransferase family 2 protein [Persicimonas caeni]QED33330.1 glycosyltransferase family 2 protein [Persicimonas caeni]
MDVTAVIPTRGDRPVMLIEAIESVERQIVEARKILVVVDASDESRQRVCELIGERPNLEVVATGGAKGVSVARNTGAELTQSEYIAFLDDDDLWRPGHLAAFLDDDFDVGLSAFWKQRRDVCVHEKTPPAVLHPRRFFATNGGCRGSNLLVRNEFFRSIGGFDPQLRAFNDVDFAIRASLVPGVRYRRNRSRDVVFRSHVGRRLSGAGSSAYREGAFCFYERYAAMMSSVERERFRVWIAKVGQISLAETKRWEPLHS